ncbi:50S ribosomal protein L25 [Patescibacteria group bacterium]|nr:50S ribosomal protein L25 [Patescibacteria group bacterium]MBU1891021.1 50S ribosomal protein L25 [Patescibacteria group bacterium]
MSEYKLQSTTRKMLGKRVKALRKEGNLPAVLYGAGIKTRPIQTDLKVFEKLYEQTGESTLIDLTVDEEKPVKVIVHSAEKNPLTEEYEHVDFYQVDLKKKITTEIELLFIGESKAVKELGGVLIKSIDHVKVECLPNDLVHELKIDISKLNSFDDSLHIKDIELPAGIKILDKEDETVVNVKPPRTDEELEALDEKVEEVVEDVEVDKEDKEKDEEDDKDKDKDKENEKPAEKEEPKKEKK